ncbi:MAG: L-2-hydroxyglutarate oxidase [Hyphomicrobiales bacterium]
MNTDFLIIGGGIVGMATALKLSEKHPDKSITVLEKEATLAAHQTGRNSGVIHAGVYYQPGSLKAEFCHKGVEATIAFCSKHQVAFEQVGKLIVATSDEELPRMEALYERSKTNGLNPVRVSVDELREREPNVAGVGALFYETSGIVDYPAMTQKMAELVEQSGGKVVLNSEVTAIMEHADHVIVETSQGQFKTDHLTVCGGLQADRLAKMAGIDIDFQVIPFRGEYYQLNRRLDDVVKHLIYPVPNPDLPFLGVHLTPMIGGEVTIGPNAVLGLAREGYAKGSINIKDLGQMIGFSGFWLSIFQNLKFGIREIRNSLSKRYYLSLCQKYCPSLTLDDLEPYKTGIRAMAVLSDGSLYHDFLVKQTPRMLHVCNAPSPAATSSLPIGDYVVELITKAEQTDAA